MNISKLTKLKNVLDLVKTDFIEDIEIETIGNTLYITSVDTDILTVLENIVEFSVADDYMNGDIRYMKISIEL